MKTPQNLAEQLVRQWHNADHREQRLLSTDAWPLSLSIGRPPARVLEHDLDASRRHIRNWESVGTGKVEWQHSSYRSASEPVQIPVSWVIHRPSEWISACADPQVSEEYAFLQKICTEANPRYHRLLIRKRHLWRGKSADQVIQATRLADQLSPDCAEGLPLRALSLEGVDSKFYETQRTLLLQLLDLRYNGQASEVGLETFLGAAPQGEHWLLLVDLDGSLLPFQQIRIRASELARMQTLPGNRLIVVENERCLHHLPQAQATLALLGAGLNLSWLSAPCLDQKHLFYWGDIDTWGLCMLSTARGLRPDIQPLLMDRTTFRQYAPASAVAEPQPADLPAHHHLLPEEIELFHKLRAAAKGRLEQEFLPAGCLQNRL